MRPNNSIEKSQPKNSADEPDRNNNNRFIQNLINSIHNVPNVSNLQPVHQRSQPVPSVLTQDERNLIEEAMRDYQPSNFADFILPDYQPEQIQHDVQIISVSSSSPLSSLHLPPSPVQLPVQPVYRRVQGPANVLPHQDHADDLLFGNLRDVRKQIRQAQNLPQEPFAWNYRPPRYVEFVETESEQSELSESEPSELSESDESESDSNNDGYEGESNFGDIENESDESSNINSWMTNFSEGHRIPNRISYEQNGQDFRMAIVIEDDEVPQVPQIPARLPICIVIDQQSINDEEEHVSIEENPFDDVAVEVNDEEDFIEMEAQEESSYELERAQSIKADQKLSGSQKDYKGEYERDSFVISDFSEKSDYSESFNKKRRLRKGGRRVVESSDSESVQRKKRLIKAGIPVFKTKLIKKSDDSSSEDKNKKNKNNKNNKNNKKSKKD